VEVITVDDLLQEVRDQSDEQSEVSPTPEALLRLSNRGLRIVNQVLARAYPDPLIRRADLDLSIGAVHPFPDDCFEGRVEALEITVPGSTPVELRSRSYRDAARQATSGSVAVPWSWDIEDEHIRLLQTPTGAYDAVAKYVRKLDPYVLQQGRVVTVGATYVIVDSAGTDLSSASDSNDSYINIVDPLTGAIRITLQVTSISGTRINFRASPIRATVQGRDVSDAADLATSDVAIDDYICLSRGTCVVQLRDTVAAYVVDFCSAALSRSTNDPGAQLETTMLRDIESRVETTGSGREATERVRVRSQAWTSPRRVWPTIRS
jgi:hypothetical protein